MEPSDLKEETMRRRGGSIAVLAMLAGVVLLPAIASGLPEPNVEICHFNADNDPDAPEWELLVVNNKSVAEKHLAHGDGFPEGEVPGTAREFVFGENCVPQVAELIFAVAYADMDANHQFDAATDLLISKLIDGPDEANDGLPGAGDAVVTDVYPTDIESNSFGTFRVKRHVVDRAFAVEEVAVDGRRGCSAAIEPGITFNWIRSDVSESYSEMNSSIETFFTDGFATTDQLRINPLSPSMPIESDIISDTGVSLTDLKFIDIDTACGSSGTQ